MKEQMQQTRRMSVRAIVTLLAVALGSLSMLVLAELVLVTFWMHQATERMASGAEGVRAAEQLDVSLRSYNREKYLFARTGDESHGRTQEKIVNEISESLETAAQHVESDQENDLLQSIKTQVREFIAQPQIPFKAKDPAAFSAYLEGSQTIDNIGAQVEQLVQINVAQANAARDESLKLEEVATASALVLAVILMLSIGAILTWVRRSLYRPFEEIRQTIGRYAAGETTIRASESYPEELGVVATSFNEMADKLAHQRETQLQFLASIAHDLRNPLMALRLAASVLEKNVPSTPREQVQHQIGIVRRQIDRLDRMVGDFMDVSLVESGQFTLQLETRDVRLLVQTVVELFRPTTSIHSLDVSIPNDACLVECDPLRLEQVLNNLVSNAIKYSPNGGTVRVACEKNANAVILSIRDQGLGISAEDRKKLFTPFSRVGRSQEKIPGIGLGLSVTKRLVEAHGGRVEVESTAGVGSTFYVYLPQKKAAIVVEPEQRPVERA